MQAGRHLGPSGIVALLAAKGALRTGLDPERAADTMFTVSSYGGFDDLVADRGWTPEQYEQWLGDTLCALLLEPARAEGHGAREAARLVVGSAPCACPPCTPPTSPPSSRRSTPA